MRDKSSAVMMAHPGFIAVVAIAQLSKDNAAVSSPFITLNLLPCVWALYMCVVHVPTLVQGGPSVTMGDQF